MANTTSRCPITTLKVGTLAEILKDVADHFGLQRDELLDQLFA
jgi:hypothetical protein